MRQRTPLTLSGVLAGLVLAMAPAQAQSLDEARRVCFELPRGAAPVLPGCTAVIAAGQEAPDRLAEAHRIRAAELALRGERALSQTAYDEAIRLDPGNIPALRGRASLLWDRGDIRGALADFEAAIQRAPRDAETFLARGYLVKRENAQAALRDFDRALSLAPDHLEGRLARAALHVDMGNAEAALADYAEAIRLAPSDWRGLLERAQLRLELDDVQGALADAEQAVRVGPGVAMAHATLAAAHDARGNLEPSLRAYDEAIRLAPDAAAARIERAQLHRRMGNLAASLADLDQVLAATPNQIDALLNRCVTRARMGAADAMRDCDAAIRLTRNSGALIARAGAAALRGDLAAARRDLDEALQAQPGNAMGQAIRVVVLRRLRQAVDEAPLTPDIEADLRRQFGDALFD